jgi:hypothetical protein
MSFLQTIPEHSQLLLLGTSLCLLGVLFRKLRVASQNWRDSISVKQQAELKQP